MESSNWSLFWMLPIFLTSSLLADDVSSENNMVPLQIISTSKTFHEFSNTNQTFSGIKLNWKNEIMIHNTNGLRSLPMRTTCFKSGSLQIWNVQFLLNSSQMWNVQFPSSSAAAMFQSWSNTMSQISLIRHAVQWNLLFFLLINRNLQLLLLLTTWQLRLINMIKTNSILKGKHSTSSVCPRVVKEWRRTLLDMKLFEFHASFF